MADTIRNKLIFHIKEISKGTNKVTPRAFHHEILPKFPISLHSVVMQMFFEITYITTNKWVYHQLKDEYDSSSSSSKED